MVGPLPPPPGGIATVMLTLLGCALRDKYNFSVLNTARKKRKYNLVSGFRVSSLYYLALNMVRLSYHLYKGKPEIVHIQSATSALLRDFLYMALGKLWGKKIVFHLHGFYANSHLAFRYEIFKHLSRFMMKRIDVLILLADAFVPAFDKFLPRTKKIVVPNFAPQSISRNTNSLKKNSKRVVNILFVGRLSRLKGAYDLIEVVKLMKEDKDIKFLLAGLGDTAGDEERIVAFINENNLSDKLILLGYVEGQEKVELFENSDIFVLPSYTEIFPVVIVEAMAAAIPVIATSVGAIRDIVADGISGFVIPPGDCHLIAEKLRYLVRYPEKRAEMGKNGLRNFERKYRIDVCVSKIDGIYQSLLRPK